MTRAIPGMMGLIALSALVVGCASPDTPLAQRLDTITADLTVGSSGDDVATLHDYLTQYGFFPNPTLAQDFPAWRPVVATPPASHEVFDASTAAAVRRLQASAGLPSTGIVDADTRNIMRMARCGNPEGLPDPDASDKFAYVSGQNFTRSASGDLVLTWRINTTGVVGVTPTEAEIGVIHAFASWAQESSLQFNEVTSGGNIVIQFGNLGTTGTLGSTSGHTITMNTQVTWSRSVSPPAGRYDIDTVATHEIGHALGIHHSAFQPVRMYPFQGQIDRTLYTDDKVAISSLYDTYQALAGTASDIAVGANGMVWKIGTNPLGNGYQVYKWNGSGWDGSDGGAYRIAVDQNGVPWVRDFSGNIYRKGDTNPFVAGTWQLLPGLARDIGIGANGAVWKVGLNALGDGWQVSKWNGSNWDPSDGGAASVSVTPSGIPWVLTNTSLNFFRHTSPDTLSGTWELLTGQSVDVGIGPVTSGGGPDGYVWSVGPTGSGKVSLAVWDEQLGSGSGGSGILSAKNWGAGVKFGVGCDGCSNMRVAVGPNGVPWVVDDTSTVYKPVR